MNLQSNTKTDKWLEDFKGDLNRKLGEIARTPISKLRKEMKVRKQIAKAVDSLRRQNPSH